MVGLSSQPQMFTLVLGSLPGLSCSCSRVPGGRQSLRSLRDAHCPAVGCKTHSVRALREMSSRHWEDRPKEGRLGTYDHTAREFQGWSSKPVACSAACSMSSLRDGESSWLPQPSQGS